MEFFKNYNTLIAKYSSSPLLTKAIRSIIIIILFWIVLKIVNKLIAKSNLDAVLKYRWKKIVTYTTVFIATLLIGRIWYEGVQSLATFFGLFSAGLAIALKDIIANIAGWIFIITKMPFSVGDRIAIGEHAGDVIDQGVFQFTILEIGSWVDADQTTGRMIHLPNGIVFTSPLTNYTQSFDYIWNEIPVLITFESNWEKAKSILKKVIDNFPDKITEDVEKHLKKASQKYLLHNIDLHSTVYTNVKDSGVMLTIRYLCLPNKRRKTSQDIWEAILREFAKENDIDLAYPTQRIFNNRLEGKVKN